MFHSSPRTSSPFLPRSLATNVVAATMSPQRVKSREALSARCAHERPLTRVDLDVSLEIMVAAKRRLA